MGIVSELRALPAAIHQLSVSVQALARQQRESGPSEERLDELERTRALWEADMEAEFRRADGKYKAAAAAEQRARKQSEKLDVFDEDRPEVQGIPPEYAPASETEGMHEMRVDVAPPNSKELALRMKYL